MMKKKQRKLKCGIFIPVPVYERLNNALSFALIQFKTIKQKESFSNAFWSISCYMINKCCYENDNLDYFVNIHKNIFEEISCKNTSIIKTIKDWLFNCYIFECNFNHCNSGPNKFSYGYRIHPNIQGFFYKKYLNENQLTKVEFNISELFLNNEFNIKINLIDRLKNNLKLNLDIIYIKRDTKHNQDIENQEFKLKIYNDRNEMNDYEIRIAERLKNITVDLKKMNMYEGNDFKKLYWIGRLINFKDTGEIKFSHGRLYRNPFWHCLPKEFRHCCLYEKKYNILEGFDVKNCFATLLLKVIEGKVSEKEYEKYKRIVRTGIYEDIAEMTTKWDRNDMKQPFCHWLFANNNTKKLPVNERFIIVRNYFKNEFPEIYNLVTNYPEIEIDENGKKIKKSRLSVDCQWIENELVLNTLCKWTEEKFNVECWTLHDAICCKEDDFAKINWSEVKEMWYKIMNLI